MRRLLARSAKAGLLAAGHYARWLRHDTFPGVAVLCYHGIRPACSGPGAMALEGLHVRADTLEVHCRFLRQACHPISLEQWRRAEQGGDALPARPVLVTFDDGYRSVWTLATPVLQRYGIPAVVFVCTDPAEQRRLLWFDGVARKHGEAAVERVKDLPFEEWQRVCDRACVPVEDADPNAIATVDEVKALADTPGFEVGGHTANHPILARASRGLQWDQIARNKECLERWTGRPVRAFAYPNGRPGQDYTAETVDLVRRAGYQAAFTTAGGFARPGEAALELPRFLMLASLSAAELAHRLCYSWQR